MPTRNGKQITLLQLVTHTSGLPKIPDNLDPKRADNPYADYTVEKMYAFLSGYKLTRDPGAKYEYSNLGMGLLGHVIALKAGTNYESLVGDRICRPLKMDSTRITLTPELKARFAQGHNRPGYAVSNWDIQTLSGAGALRSTANDMLKYVSANLGLIPSSLTPLMEKTHVVHYQSAIPNQSIALAWGAIALAWGVGFDPQGREIVSHSGGTAGYTTFAGFDKTRRRGVVVLDSSNDGLDVIPIGMLLLESEWQSDRRPKETNISRQVYDSYVGQYQLSPDFALGMVMMRLLLINTPKAVIYIPAGFCLTVLVILLWRAASFRKRCIILGCTALVSSLLAVLIALVSSHVVCALFHPGIGIRREGDRIFVQYDIRLSPVTAKFLPHITGELLPESETRFFERMTGMPITFSRDDRGKVTRLTVRFLGNASAYEKISDEPPKAPEPVKPRVAIKLDPKLLDAIVGHYEHPPQAVWPTAGIKVTIWREGDRLFGQAQGKDVLQGAFEIYPESETNFFLKVNGAQLTFIKNDKGEVTTVIHHAAGYPDSVGKKLKE